jgi:hypothetical protein
MLEPKQGFLHQLPLPVVRKALQVRTWFEGRLACFRMLSVMILFEMPFCQTSLLGQLIGL